MGQLLIEYLRKNGEPLLLAELGVDFLKVLGLPMAQAQRPFRVEATPKVSKAGNTYYDYIQQSVPLPDGLETRMRVGGVEVTFGPERESQKGNPTREGNTVVALGDTPYEVTVYLSRSKQPYWVKVHAHKASGSKRSAPGGPISGGRIV